MFSSTDLQADCHGVQHWLQKWMVLRLIWTDAMLLALAALVIVTNNNDVSLPIGICSSKVASHCPTSKNLVGELRDRWCCGISHLGRHKKLMQKKDQMTGIHRSWLGRDYSSLCSLWAECALAIDFASLSKISVSGTKSMGNIPLFCFNLSWRALHLIADQWIWLLPLS